LGRGGEEWLVLDVPTQSSKKHQTFMMEDGALRDAQPTGDYEEAATPKLQERMDKATQDQVR
jgi:hypothetical protein